jgi:hypothetical protein
MDFILSRLQNIEQVQQIELQEMRDSRDWYKEAAKGRDGYGLPDATRWHESAHLYQRAGQALCRGDLGRGADLLERATAEERRAQDSTPRQVAEHLNDASRAHAQSPMGAEELSTAAMCSAIIEPQELKVADRIRNIQDVMETSPPLPIRSTKHWWEEEEEEEEEGESGDS